MNLLQMPCVITWSWSFLTSEVVETVRGQKYHISGHTLALRLNIRFIPQCQFCLPKIHQEMRSVITFSLHLASISWILEPSPIFFLLFFRIFWSQVRRIYFEIFQDTSLKVQSPEASWLFKSQVLERWISQNWSLGTCTSNWKVR